LTKKSTKIGTRKIKKYEQHLKERVMADYLTGGAERISGYKPNMASAFH
jgi:hypothetical protein